MPISLKKVFVIFLGHRKDTGHTGTIIVIPKTEKPQAFPE